MLFQQSQQHKMVGGVRKQHHYHTNEIIPIYNNNQQPILSSGMYTSQRRRRRQRRQQTSVNGSLLDGTTIPNNDDIYYNNSNNNSYHYEEETAVDEYSNDNDNRKQLQYTSNNNKRKLQSVFNVTLLCIIFGYWIHDGLYLSSPIQVLTGLYSTMTLSSLSSMHHYFGGDGSTVRNDHLRPDQEEDDDDGNQEEEDIGPRPSFVYEHPYVSSSYYTSTKSMSTLLATQNQQVVRNLRQEAEQAAGIDSEGVEAKKKKTRLAIVRPFCEFDAEALPTTFTCWNALSPCKAAADDIGDDDYDDYEDEELYEVNSYGELIGYNTNTTAGRALYNQDRHTFDLVGSSSMKNANADVFLFYSQTFSENDVAIQAVDAIIDSFFEPGGWSQCFGNIYAIEANIPQELDLYIPSAQEELYSWVNGPNRQFEAAFRIIQSGEWGEYDGFYLMEGDSVPVKAHWLDVVLSEIEVNRPFAILGE